jgi:hypothetical protein
MAANAPVGLSQDGRCMKKEKFLRTAARLANIILAGSALVCLVALSYFVYQYGWTGQRQFMSVGDVVVYYLVPAGLAILLLASLRLAPARKVIAASGCLLVAISAYGTEIYLAVDRLNLDTRHRTEVVADFRRQGVEAVIQVSLPLFERQDGRRVRSLIAIRGVETMPLGGIADKVTVSCNQNGEPLAYRTDEHGFNNPKGTWRSPTIEIAAVGNSFTLGYCVSPDENFVAHIRRRYPATLNLGMPGAGPLQVLAILQEYALPFKPKLVLWFYSEANSLLELQKEKQSPILMRYLRHGFSQNLLALQSELDEALMDRSAGQSPGPSGSRREQNSSIVEHLVEVGKLGHLRRELGMIYGELPAEPESLSKSELSQLEADFDLLREILSEAKARVDAWGGKLHLVYLPCWERFAQHAVIGVKARDRTLSLVNELGVPVIDAYPAFQGHSDPLSLFPFRGPGHYNQEGHRLLADTVLDAVSRRHREEFQLQGAADPAS